MISLASVGGLELLIINITKKQPKVSTKDVVIFSRQFSTMINSGLPILQGLSIVAEQAENKDFRGLMSKVRDDISNGIPLSEAISRHPKVFSTLYVNMVKAGEQGGILDIIFERLSEYMEKAEGVTRKVKSAMMYPIVVMSVACLVVIFLMVKVVPTFAEVFQSFGAELPLPTRMVLGLSNFLISPKAVFLVIFVVGAIIAFNLYKRTKSGAFNVDKVILKLPVFGVLARKAAVAKFARTFGTLIKSGVPIMDALETVAKTSGNLVVEKALIDARDSVRAGKTLTQPLKESNIFPPMVTQMINVGEETGALDAMLSKVADFYEEEVDTAVDGITTIIEPILIVFLGVTLGFIVVAMFMPMFELGNLAG
ncbi:MAG TPA: type II secretion system F family protein [bacterium]|nr:type II secretion system F family protein [bacterium]